MPECPQCKKELDSLDYHAKEYRCYPVTVKGIDYDKGETDDVEEDYYCCPECRHVFYFTEEEATDFLKGRLDTCAHCGEPLDVDETREVNGLKFCKRHMCDDAFARRK